MFDQYRWRGEIIPDIRAWAAARGERMVPHRAERTTPNLVTGRLEQEVYEGEMPESFWSGLLMRDGWIYRERTP